MTRDEIRAEFEALAKRHDFGREQEAYDWLRAAYLAAAEAREKRIAELEQERDRAVEVADAATKCVYSKYMLEAADAIGRDLAQGLEINGLKFRLARVTEALRASLSAGDTHYAHFDRQGTAGANCPACIARLKANEMAYAALSEEQEQKP
jgi:hypothetical protein